MLGEFSHYQPADGSDAVDAGQPVLPKAVQVKTVLPVAYIGSTPYTSLQQAVQDAGDKAVIELAQGLVLDQPLAVSAKALTLTGKDGGSYTVSRKDSYSGSLVSVESGGQLTLKNIILDGGAIWSAETSGTAPAKRRGKIPISAGGGSERDFGFGCRSGAAKQRQ